MARLVATYLVVVWQFVELVWWTQELRVTAQQTVRQLMKHWLMMVWLQLLSHFSVYVPLQDHGVLQHFACR